MADLRRCARALSSILTVALATLLGASTSCGDDTVTPSELGRACGRALSWGHWEDGSMRALGTRRHVCLCMSEEEFESDSRLDELHERMLLDCKQEAASFEMDWDECEEDFAEGHWITYKEPGDHLTWPTEGGVIHPPGVSLVCP